MAAVNVYMPLADQRIGLAAYKPTLDRLGIGVTPFKDGADSVLLVSDHTAVSVGGHPAYMPASSLEKILNRDRLHETGLATLPTVVIERPEDAPSGTLAKPRNSATGGWVHQPHLGFPVEDLDIHFSVGRSGDIHVIAAQRHKHLDTKKPAELRMATPDEYVGVCEQITAACKRSTSLAACTTFSSCPTKAFGAQSTGTHGPRRFTRRVWRTSTRALMRPWLTWLACPSQT
jgi:hypothetical protein